MQGCLIRLSTFNGGTTAFTRRAPRQHPAVARQSQGWFGPRKGILTRNLFGVDLNAESIEITKLSLWRKTAEQGRQLDTLEADFLPGQQPDRRSGAGPAGA